MHLYSKYGMDAQHVICAGYLSHVTRQTDNAICYKSAEFRYMAGTTI